MTQKSEVHAEVKCNTWPKKLSPRHL